MGGAGTLPIRRFVVIHRVGRLWGFNCKLLPKQGFLASTVIRMTLIDVPQPSVWHTVKAGEHSPRGKSSQSKLEPIARDFPSLTAAGGYKSRPSSVDS